MQGEREFVKDNKSLGNFRLDGIPPAPRGIPQIEVKFDIDANGILSVSAKDKGTGKQQDIKITGASTLSSDDVERMVKDAEKNAEEDKRRRSAVDTRNQADSMVYQTGKQIKELGDKVPAALKEKVEAKLKALNDAIASDSEEGMKAAMEALNQEACARGIRVQDTLLFCFSAPAESASCNAPQVMEMGKQVYSQAGAGGAPGGEAPPGGAGGAKPDDVIDADFTDSK